MNTYRPDRRDPLTQRFARSVADTQDDPYAYSEGSAEPQRLIVTKDESDHAVDRLLRRWGLVAIVVLIVVILVGGK